MAIWIAHDIFVVPIFVLIGARGCVIEVVVGFIL
jgi:hypothetical protein